MDGASHIYSWYIYYNLINIILYYIVITKFVSQFHFDILYYSLLYRLLSCWLVGAKKKLKVRCEIENMFEASQVYIYI